MELVNYIFSFLGVVFGGVALLFGSLSFWIALMTYKRSSSVEVLRNMILKYPSSKKSLKNQPEELKLFMYTNFLCLTETAQKRLPLLSLWAETGKNRNGHPQTDLPEFGLNELLSVLDFESKMKAWDKK